jgi:hypothetical protein
MKANNFNVMKGLVECTGWKAWKVKKIYASNGILEVADLLDKFSPYLRREYRFL